MLPSSIGHVTMTGNVILVRFESLTHWGRYFADDVFKCIFLNENVWSSLNISLKFVPMVRNNNVPSLVQIMAWRRSGDEPLSEPRMVNVLTHICVSLPQLVKSLQVIWRSGTGGVYRRVPSFQISYRDLTSNKLHLITRQDMGIIKLNLGAPGY